MKKVFTSEREREVELLIEALSAGTTSPDQDAAIVEILSAELQRTRFKSLAEEIQRVVQVIESVVLWRPDLRDAVPCADLFPSTFATPNRITEKDGELVVYFLCGYYAEDHDVWETEATLKVDWFSLSNEDLTRTITKLAEEARCQGM